MNSLECFQTALDKTTSVCPLCRKRIRTFARKNRDSLVDKELEKLIDEQPKMQDPITTHIPHQETKPGELLRLLQEMEKENEATRQKEKKNKAKLNARAEGELFKDVCLKWFDFFCANYMNSPPIYTYININPPFFCPFDL